MARRRPKSNADRPSRGERQRERILTEAIQLASAQGLEALTIGQMASALDMSKSGLFAHFGSKLKLQLATVERAQAIFVEAVRKPAEEMNGIVRVWGLCDLWLKHLDGRVFPSGYFFTGAFLEYGHRTGLLANRLQESAKQWILSIERAVRQAQDKEELKEGSVESIAFEINALLVGAYWSCLAGNEAAYSEARKAILGRLPEWTTDHIPRQVLKNVNTWRKYVRARAQRGSGK
jgi:AcrR family transcriptional regulator